MPKAQIFSQENLVIRTHDNEYNFTVEIADTLEKQKRGLMERTTLADNSGMLFILPAPAAAKMWMKNTRIPLDMLFIDSKGTIVSITENTTPESTALIGPDIPVKAILELPAGTVKRLTLSPGAHIIHRCCQ